MLVGGLGRLVGEWVGGVDGGGRIGGCNGWVVVVLGRGGGVGVVGIRSRQ